MEAFFFWRRKKRKPHKFNMDGATTPLEYRSTDSLLSIARSWLNTNETKQILSTVEAGRPSKTELPIGLTTDQMAHQAAFSAGYEHALNTIYSLAKPLKMADEVDPTFEDPD
jgi:hypothetical protein